jgi:hypothetical protein
MDARCGLLIRGHWDGPMICNEEGRAFRASVVRHGKKGLSIISNRQRRKEGTFCASELAGIEPTPPAPEEQGMCAFRQLG